jgi:hypothetical protein
VLTQGAVGAALGAAVLLGCLAACGADVEVQSGQPNPGGSGPGGSAPGGSAPGGSGGSPGCEAGDDFVLDEGNSAVLSGEQVFANFELGSAQGPPVSTVQIAPYDPAMPGSGWLHVKAHTITIHRFGRIDAAAAGYQGTVEAGSGYGSDGAGQTPPDPTPGPTPPPGPAAPGGGGAHVAVGGAGTLLAGCSVYPEAAGGLPYAFDPQNPLLTGMGSSGGSGHSGVNPTASVRGGHGGGVVVLEAATVALEGAVWVDGEDALTLALGVGVLGGPAAGGAAGTIIVRANSFTFDDAFTDPDTATTTLLSARGGRGALDAASPTAIGGSGSGGLVTLEIGAGNDALLGHVDVSGGASQSAACPAGPAGGAGQAAIAAAPPCIDADGDGHADVACGGDDCAEGNAAANPDTCTCAPGR